MLLHKIKQREEYRKKYLDIFRENYKITAHEYNKNAQTHRLFGGFSTSRNLIFEHHGCSDTPKKSLFEEILGTPNMSELIHMIWDEFELWRKEKVLKMVSKYLKLMNKPK